MRLGASPTAATTVAHSQPLSPLNSAPPKQPALQGPLYHQGFSESACEVHRLTGLVVLDDFFFNSFVVGVPYSWTFLALLVVY